MKMICVWLTIICICAAHETAIKFDETFAPSSASHVMPSTPLILGLYDQFMRQIGQYESIEAARKFMEEEARKYRGTVEWTKSKSEGGQGGSLRATLRVGPQVCFTLREIPVMKANTVYSPIYDAVGAEHELHHKYGMPVRSITPDVVSVMREMLTRQYYEAEES